MLSFNLDYFLLGLFIAFIYYYINYPRPELLSFKENFTGNSCKKI